MHVYRPPMCEQTVSSEPAMRRHPVPRSDHARGRLHRRLPRELVYNWILILTLPKIGTRASAYCTFLLYTRRTHDFLVQNTHF
jgi:hypothetical protein